MIKHLIPRQKLANTVLASIAFVLVWLNPGYANDTITAHAPPSPWAWEEGTRMAGPVIDLARKIFADLDIRIETKNLPWKRAIKYIETGKLDLMLVMFYTEDRSTFFDFSIPYADEPTSVFVPKGKSFPFTQMEDLKGKHGLMVRGDSLGKNFDEILPVLQVSPKTNLNRLIKMLAAGRADYAVYAKYAFIIQARKLSLSQEIEILPTPIATNPLYFGFSKKSSFIRYLPQVNQKIQQFKADGTIDAMIEAALNAAAIQ